MKYPVDNPIIKEEDDLLGRKNLAELFVKTLRSIDATKGAVVSVMGAWGSGKTSFINLVKQELEETSTIPVIEFNPWMFSGSEQLPEIFFHEIAVELKLMNNSKIDKVSDAISEYSDALSILAYVPYVGKWLDRSIRTYKSLHKLKKEKGAKQLRKKVANSLEKLEHPILIVLDDIDRLSSEEIRDIFKLVRLTASFPNVVYLLAFDRLRVEAALSETNVSGRAYLEKIIQFAFDLPLIPQKILQEETFKALGQVLEDKEDLRFNENIWPDIFFDTIQPYINNLRDIHRLTLAMRPTLIALSSEIETVDLIALETLRVFQPEIFSQLKPLQFALTQYKHEKDENETYQSMLENFIAKAGARENEVRSLIYHLFPAACRYIESYNPVGENILLKRKCEHRVSDIDFLNRYLEHFSSHRLHSFFQAEALFQVLSNRNELETHIRSLEDDDLENTLSELLSFESQFPAEAAIPASIVFLNLIPKIPHKQPSSILDVFGSEITIEQLIYRLLRRLDSVSECEKTVSEIIPELQTYSSQLYLINLVRYKEHVGLKLVSEQFSERIKTEFYERVKGTHSPFPDKEWDLLRVLITLQEWDQREKEPDPFFFDSIDEIRSLFSSARTTRRFQRGNEVKIHVEERLQWDDLVSVFNGDEKALETARNRLHKVDGDSPLIGLIDKYLSGWRPGES